MSIWGIHKSALIDPCVKNTLKAKLANNFQKRARQNHQSHLNTFIIAVFDINFRFDPHPPMKSDDILGQ